MQLGNFLDEMAAFAKLGATVQRPGRRRFLWSMAAFGLTRRIGSSETPPEQVYRFVTPVCEVRMSVEHFTSSSIRGLHFRDDLTNRTFCLSASGEKDLDCLEGFVGSMAIAHYYFRSPHHAATPHHLRARVLTIDHDRRIRPRPPFERMMAVEGAAVSDIQAFGYKAGDAQQTASDANSLAAWYLVRQDLYLNDQATAFLIVHWKHALDLISLLDVISGDGTRLISD